MKIHNGNKMRIRISLLASATSLLSFACAATEANENTLLTVEPTPPVEQEYHAYNSVGFYILSKLDEKIRLEQDLQEANSKISNLEAKYFDLASDINLSKNNNLEKDLHEKLSLGNLRQNYFYETNKHVLDDESLKTLTKVFKVLSNDKDVKLDITGRADPRGNTEYNHALAAKRIGFVKALALKSGFDENQISINNLGEFGEPQKNTEKYFFQRYLTVEISKNSK